jgi:hypothetical protein
MKMGGKRRGEFPTNQAPRMIGVALIDILVVATTTMTMSSMANAFAFTAVVVPHRRRHRFGNFNQQQQLQRRHFSKSSLHSSINDDDDDDEIWSFDDINNKLNNDDTTDTRLDALRSILELSWNQPSMGIVPTTPTNAAIAATECISNAIQSSSSSNIMMIDLRLPSYDIIEGQRAYDSMAVYNFGVELASRMQQIGLVRKSLLLVRNGRECDEMKINTDEYENDNDDEDNLLSKWRKEEEADEFRKNLMSSWESSSSVTNSEANKDSSIVSSTSSSSSSSSSYSKSASSEDSKVIIDDTHSASHRLWSMVGNELNNNDIDTPSSAVDTFNDIISAVDVNARLQSNEDAIIILSPYDTTDIVALRRILSRYGPTRIPIIIVNARFNTNPIELDNALLVYGMLPLVAKAVRESSSSRKEEDNTTNTPGLRAVIMKRYPKDWTVYVDVNGDGFVEAKNDNDRSGGVGGGSTKSFPSSEWIAQRVQAHVEGQSQRRDIQ